ncbi:hypothetical protein WMF39_11760 [Sorangium sp. So ce1504]|uniref:hypothetical protein n=1 Tax=Sorangium sp. So ce1504 TaxID=3133337 RepID=UPI003F62ECE8
MSATVYDRNVDFYIDFVDRGLKSNRYLPLLTLMTDLNGARVCDLCCGEGYLGRHLIAHGAHEVPGIDASTGWSSLSPRGRSRRRLQWRRSTVSRSCAVNRFDGAAARRQRGEL